ncbi:DNA-deoxyinosine glycosylase [Paenibacillus lignilyticus]|uniref:DNA-deoxyinosine glycosylase n=1 Tax=Paenibacillus lignilyticus TaxID=1172615 RepID=A0ABS5CJB6_9BACL|nr:DNA-deoxyinosine glycosylase [Paenibacillus lignilyticus]MBP3965958.1 DNA-deoxyinosine glycosylase [Paenibacillus lignilyticus]
MRVHSFPPEIGDRARVLVLGSMPGTASLAKHQYYAHPRNHLWPVVYGLFGLTPDADYEERLAFAKARGIALWDVIESCQREGSLDVNIREERPNDIPGLLAEYPEISCIVCNGAKSHDTFLKYFKSLPELGGITLLKLPSTSPIPTAAMRTTADRIEAWRILLPYLIPLEQT